MARTVLCQLSRSKVGARLVLPRPIQAGLVYLGRMSVNAIKVGAILGILSVFLFLLVVFVLSNLIGAVAALILLF